MAHIKSLHDETNSLCDMVLNGEFYFKSIDAAILNGLHEKKPITCKACCAVIIESILNGVERCEQTENATC